MIIKTARTESEVLRCFPAFTHLRPHLDEATFLTRWREQRETGYELIYINAGETVAAAAGFRIMTTMAWGKILYLDDLIALPAQRGRGLGTALLQHLQAETIARGCVEMHLDTGYTRHDAHRSYLRNGFDLNAHHLSWTPDFPLP